MPGFNLQTRIAIDRGGQSLDLMRKALLRAAAEIARYDERYRETDDLAEMARIMNAAILHVTANVLPNVRIDLAADAQAELAAANGAAP